MSESWSHHLTRRSLTLLATVPLMVLFLAGLLYVGSNIYRASAIISLSNISTSVTSSSITINWNTDINSNAYVTYAPGINTVSPTSINSQSATSTTSHSVTIPSLQPCTIYYWDLSDQATVNGTKIYGSFPTSGEGPANRSLTGGCPGGASVVTDGSWAPLAVYNNPFTLGSMTATVNNLSASPTTNNNKAEYQNFQLSNAAMSSSNAPSGKQLVADDFYVLQEFIPPSGTQATNGTPPTIVKDLTVSSINQSIDVSFSYTTTQVPDPSSLAMVRWDGSSWTALTGCTSNTTGHTYKCSTNKYSTYFALVQNPITSGGGGGGGTTTSGGGGATSSGGGSGSTSSSSGNTSSTSSGTTSKTGATSSGTTSSSSGSTSSGSGTTTSTGAPVTVSSLTIKLLDPNGQPLVGATVTLHSATQTATTDSKGQATFTNVPVGNHTIDVTSAAYSQTRPVAVLADSGAQPLVVTLSASNLARPFWQFLLIALVIVLIIVAVSYFIARRKLAHAHSLTEPEDNTQPTNPAS